MSVEKLLHERSNSRCELCSGNNELRVYTVPPATDPGQDDSLLVCSTCYSQIENPEAVEVNHWRCLNDSMWSPFLPVQIMAWRMLTRLKDEGWPQDLLDMMYMDEETLARAKAGIVDDEPEDTVKHLDSNGTLLQTGDTVVLIKDLNVKGGGFTAKRGTAVRNITLVPDNAEQIEGRVNGQQIVILTRFVKKN